MTVRLLTRAAVLAALALGLVAGAVVALAIGRGDAPRLVGPPQPALAAQDDPGAPRPAPAGDPRRPRIAAARPVPRGVGMVQLRPRGPIRVELRVPDPRGGPDWAVRTFVADRVTPPEGRRPGVDPVIGRPRCAQLGRIVGGRFGRIDAANTFRPVPVAYRVAPLWCGSRLPALGGRPPHLDLRVRITDPRAGAARALQTVAWGMAGSGTRPRMRVRGRSVAVPRTPSGVALAVGGPEVRPGQVELVADGRRATGGGGGGEAATAMVDARAPDPHGGLPYGVAVTGDRAAAGDVCATGPGRVVGDRVGFVDHEPGTMDTATLSRFSCTGRQAPLTRARPFTFGAQSGGSADEPGADPLAGRAARRTLRGLTIIHGRALPEVTRLTIATPRDVRTLIPSKRFGTFLAAYDGTFPTGEVVMTATLRDGTTRTQRLSLGF